MTEGGNGRSVAAAIATFLVLQVMFVMAPVPSVEAAPSTPWYLSTVAIERQSIYDMAIGEVDASSPGMEIVVTGGGGIINQYSSDTFELKPLYAVLKTQQGVAIGDISSKYPGNEIVSVGVDWNVHVLHKEGEAWVAETAWTSIGSINGVTIGEFNASHPGKEIAVAGDEAIVAILTEDLSQPNDWAITVLRVNTIAITNMMAASADILGDSPGDEIFVGSFSGHAYMIRWDQANSTWNITIIWRDDFAILGFGIGADLVPEIAGPEVYVAGFSGKVELVYHNGTNWTNMTLFQDPKPMYSVVPGDFDPRHPGPELLACGNGKNLHLLTYSDGNWSYERIVDPVGNRLDLLYDLKLAEVDSTHPGLEVMIGGYNQELLELKYIEPDFQIEPTPTTQTAISGQVAHFWLLFKAVGYFSGSVALTSMDPGVQMSRTSAEPGDLVEVSITVPQVAGPTTLRYNITGTSSQIGKNRDVTLTVEARPSSSYGIDLEMTPDIQTMAPGFSTNFVAKSTVINDWSPVLEYSHETLLPTLAWAWNWDETDPNVPAVLSLTSSTQAAKGQYQVVVRCKATDQSKAISFEATAVVTVVIDTGTLFTINAVPDTLSAAPYSTVHVSLTLNSLNDFTGEVLLSVQGLPPEAKGRYSSMLTRVPSTLTYSLEMGQIIEPSISVLTFTAINGTTVQTATTLLYLLNSTGADDFSLSVLPDGQVLRPGAMANLLLRVQGPWPSEIEADTTGLPMTVTISDVAYTNSEYRLLTVNVRNDAKPGVFKPRIIGRHGQDYGWEHNATFTIIVATDVQNLGLSMDTAEMVLSPGQSRPTFYISASENRDLLVGSPLKYRAIGLKPIPTTTIIDDFNYSRPLIMPDLSVTEGTYLFLLVVDVPNHPYGETTFGTLRMTGPVAILDLKVKEETWGLWEGSHNKVSTTVSNTGEAPSGVVHVEVLLDGKSICRASLNNVPPHSNVAGPDCQWKNTPGDHNVTYIIQVDDEDAGRVLSGPRTTEYPVHAHSVTGPIIAGLLMLLAVALVFFTKRSKGTEANAKQPVRRKDEEE